MPLIKYIPRSFNKKSKRVIEIANSIIAEYSAQGYTLTLRQLYYQFVARDLIKNKFQEYKNLGNIINDARLAGLIDWEAIEDRVRNVGFIQTWEHQSEFANDAVNWFHLDFWKDQNYRVEVWVEKDALVGIIERVSNRLRCSYLACRGYVSQSEVWRAGQRIQMYNANGQQAIIIHLGDHDPSGIDMTRDNRERLNMLSEFGDVKIIRVALNYDQVQQYNPPPNPVKFTDNRAEGYQAQHGDESWELDALEPQVIECIISDEIEKYIDWDKWHVVEEKEKAAQAELKMLAGWWKDGNI